MAIHHRFPLLHHIRNLDYDVRLESDMLRDVVEKQICDMMDRQRLQRFESAIPREAARIPRHLGCGRVIRMLVLHRMRREHNCGLKCAYFPRDPETTFRSVLESAIAREVEKLDL